MKKLVSLLLVVTLILGSNMPISVNASNASDNDNIVFSSTNTSDVISTESAISTQGNPTEEETVMGETAIIYSQGNEKLDVELEAITGNETPFTSLVIENSMGEERWLNMGIIF